MGGKTGRIMYVPQDIAEQIERMQRDLGVSGVDAMRLIMRGGKRGEDKLEFKI